MDEAAEHADGPGDEVGCDLAGNPDGTGLRLLYSERWWYPISTHSIRAGRR